MGKKTYLVGSVAATAGLLVAGSPAFADSYDNDGINIGNDNNASVLPIQACGNNVAVLGVVAPILSPQEAQCVNAPIVDHPSVDNGDDHDDKPGDDGDDDKPGDDGGDDDGKTPDDNGDHGDNGGDDGKTPDDDGDNGGDDEGKGGGGETDLPSAPTPEIVTGHAAVTG